MLGEHLEFPRSNRHVRNWSRMTMFKNKMNFILRYLALTLFGFCLAANSASAAANAGNDSHSDKQWLKEHLLDDNAQQPFSFAYDRQGGSVLLKAWPKKIETKQLDSVRTE